MKFRHSAGSKKDFEKYVKNRFSGWSIKNIKTIKPAMKTFAGTYEAILDIKIKKVSAPKIKGDYDEYFLGKDPRKTEYYKRMKKV